MRSFILPTLTLLLSSVVLLLATEQETTMESMDFDKNVYITVTTALNSYATHNPASLALHPAMSYVGRVGELEDVHVVSVPKANWSEVKDDVLRSLSGLDCVRKVDVQQPPKQRVKRSGEEL